MVPLLSLVLALPTPVPAAKPNVVLIYADDLGYGDISCHGAAGVKTPNVDRIAREGIDFRDGHSAAATCTPSRYAMMTGDYAFRQKGTGILPGDANLIIRPGRTTMATALRDAGYRTGAVGKWHLGLGDGPIDWNKPISPGPKEVGFDTSFVLPATGDRVPCVYLDNGRVANLDPADPITVSYSAAKPAGDEPTGKARPDLLRMHPSHGHDQTIVNGVSRIGTMSGGKSARWVDEEMADTFARKGVEFIESEKGRPFFLYFATHDVHVPRVPHPRFKGASTMGPRGDAIAEFDWSVGRILEALDKNGLADNTLVILTSDNGPVLDDGYKDDAVQKVGAHKPAGPWRGGKGGAFEGATRGPFLVRWPARVKPGASDALVSQVDFLPSFAALVGRPMKPGESPDGVNVLPALLGDSPTGRDHLVEQAGILALREGNWKYIEPGRGPAVSANTGTETGHAPGGQLFDLAADPGERENLIEKQPERAKAMRERLAKIRGGTKP